MVRIETAREMPVPPVLRPALDRAARNVQLAALFTLLFTVVAIIAAPVVLQYQFVPACALMQLWNFPCAFCGGTRTLAALGSLQLVEAIRLNPLIAFASVTLVFSAVACLARPALAAFRPRWALVLAVSGTVIVANWVYLIFYLPR